MTDQETSGVDANASELLDFFKTSSQEVSQYLGNLIPAMVELPERLRDAGTQDAAEVIASCGDGLTLLIQYASAAQQIALIKESGLAERLAGIEKQLSEAIIQMADTLEARDNVLLADIVEYELLPALELMQEVVGKVEY